MNTTIFSNGSKWVGQQPDSVDTLITVLSEHPLDPTLGKPIDRNENTGDSFFFGNFLTVSHVFNICSNEPEVVDRLTVAINANRGRWPWPKNDTQSPLDADDIATLNSHAGRHILAGVELSPWIVVSDYCATRVVAGTDPLVVANRRAFIEKSPRVMVGDDATDRDNWYYGVKGTDGFDPKSREWCDAALRLLGAVLPEFQT
jgi:hypothetical protein